MEFTDKNPIALWAKCLNIIRDNLNESQYKTWFEPITFVSYEENNLLIQVPSQFFYEFIEENFLDLMRSTLHRVFGEGVTLTYDIEVDQTNEKTVKYPQSDRSLPKKAIVGGNKAPTQADAAPQSLDPRLNPDYNFTNFIEGYSNKLSRSIGMAVADKPAKTAFNPLFIYGPSGVGKTHLINAIGTKIKVSQPQMRVLYVSAHLFMVQYTDSVRNNTFNDFINFYQTIDVLIIDDIQELSGIKKTQNAFFHIFNHLHQNGKQLILTSDRAPAEMQDFEDRLLTRFKWGMVAELEKPNTELRKAILERRINKDGLIIKDEVVDFIASNVDESVRDLEGIVNSLLAYSVVYNCDVNMQLAEKVIGRAVRSVKKEVTIEDILHKTCGSFNVTLEDVYSRSRKKPTSQARQVSMYLIQKYTNLPTTRIGQLVGKRDHATVIHSVKQVEEQIKYDKVFCQQIQNLEVELKTK